MPSDPVVIVDVVRTPIGRRGGGLSSVHPAELQGLGLTGATDLDGGFQAWLRWRAGA